MSHEDTLYKILPPQQTEKRHRKITKIMKELGNIPKGRLPEWAAYGKDERTIISYGIIADYNKPSGNNYSDYCAHIKRLEEIAEKNRLTLRHTADYASFVNQFGREVAIITYSVISHTPDMARIKNTKQAETLIDECMSDFKKAK